MNNFQPMKTIVLISTSNDFYKKFTTFHRVVIIIKLSILIFLGKKNPEQVNSETENLELSDVFHS